MTYILTKPSNVTLTMDGMVSKLRVKAGLRGTLIKRDGKRKLVVLRYAGDAEATLQISAVVFGKYWKEEGAMA